VYANEEVVRTLAAAVGMMPRVGGLGRADHAHASSTVRYCCVVGCKYDGDGSGRIIWHVGVRDTVWV